MRTINHVLARETLGYIGLAAFLVCAILYALQDNFRWQLTFAEKSACDLVYITLQ